MKLKVLEGVIGCYRLKLVEGIACHGVRVRNWG